MITGEEFGGMHHQAELLRRGQHLIEFHFEILVAEMDFNEVEIAFGRKAFNVVITNRQPKAMEESVRARDGGRGLEV